MAALKTRSVFYYGHTINLTNKFLDIDEGSGVVSIELQEGAYTPTQFCQMVSTKVNELAVNDWLFTFNRLTREIVITVNASSSILGSSGPNVANSAMFLLGLDLLDYGPFLNLTTGESCTEYIPQFTLQSYMGSDKTKRPVSAVVTRSASGKKVSVQSFGIDRLVKFNITYITNVPQPSNDIIMSSSTGLSDALSFLEYATEKAPIEFMVDGSNRLVFESIMLEATPADTSGVGYELVEMYDRGLPYYYETGLLTWLVVD